MSSLPIILERWLTAVLKLMPSWAGDLFAGESCRDQFQNFCFARRQALEIA
jgi:hypothetical protein